MIERVITIEEAKESERQALISVQENYQSIQASQKIRDGKLSISAKKAVRMSIFTICEEEEDENSDGDNEVQYIDQ